MTVKVDKKQAYSKLPFTPDDEEKIISFVKENPELYDPKHLKFKDKSHKDKLWNDLGESFGDTKSG